MNIKVISSASEITNFSHQTKNQGEKLGFVPTMGALHDGHLSLIREAQKHAEQIVCSIFVNPTQFNDPRDLDKYPRTLEADLEKLESVGCDVVFTPNYEEIYANEQAFDFDFNGLDRTMEGANRPGHFMGVVRVVKRFFEIVQPDLACFGLKDYQQYAIIKQLVRYFDMPIEIVGCPIIREKNGLAMSSRNARLSEEELLRALHLSRILHEVKAIKGSISLDEAKTNALSELQKFTEPEYFEIAEPDFLQPVSSWNEASRLRAFVAAKVGNVRLIDNLEL